MSIIYRDLSIVGWIALAAFLLFLCGFSAGRRRWSQPTFWLAFTPLIAIATAVVARPQLQEMAVGSKWYPVAIAQDPEAADLVNMALGNPFLHCGAVAALSIFIHGLQRGWYVTLRDGEVASADAGAARHPEGAHEPA